MSAASSAAAARAALPSVLLVGANRGLGLEAALSLLAAAPPRARALAATARDWAAAPAAAAALSAAAAAAGVPLDLATVDVADAASRAALLERAGAGRPWDVLILNAGVFPLRRGPGATAEAQWTPAGLAATLAVNTAGPLRLAREAAAAGALAPGGRARVCAVSSSMGALARVAPAYRAALAAATASADVEALEFMPEGGAGGGGGGAAFGAAYSLSKAALNRGAGLLARELAPAGVAVYTVDPGWCRTDMGGDEAPRSAAEGAASIVRVALDATSPSGSVHGPDGRVVPP